MMNKIFKISGLVFVSLIFLTTGPVLGANGKNNTKTLDYIKQFRPSTTKPSLSIPSANAVKEVGGIQYGHHVDIKLNDGRRRILVFYKCIQIFDEINNHKNRNKGENRKYEDL